jgi:hypothetical protein
MFTSSTPTSSISSMIEDSERLRARGKRFRLALQQSSPLIEGPSSECRLKPP